MNKNFDEIKDYEEFISYYWYLDELKEICKAKGIDSDGLKKELNERIRKYFDGEIVKKVRKANHTKNIVSELTLETKLLECGFTFGPRFKQFFVELTNNPKFKFNADMAASVKKVREDNITDFTLGDLYAIYNKEKEFVKYDKSSCQWNKFLHDFSLDERTRDITNKKEIAITLWNQVRDSNKPKVYTKEILTEYLNEKK